MQTRLYFIHALTALHVGTGQGIGVIDLPIARERATGLPMVPGSGIKGVLREALRPEGDADREDWLTLFGPEPRSAEESAGHAGALSLGDALLLCLPVRSARGTFAWVTSPLLLKRLQRDWRLADGGGEGLPEAIPTPEEQEAGLTANSCLTADNGTVVLEELDLLRNPALQAQVDEWAGWISRCCFPDDDVWQPLFAQRFLVASDAVLQFLAETATEVRARIRIQENTRTVARGALWYEENLPAETLLWGILGCTRSRRPGRVQEAAELVAILKNGLVADEGECRIQLGGKATVGRGQVRWILSGD